ncbi:transglutaminase-like putative cysteine protease [Azorhizobium sp. AG788]|uniref:transglutaminase family protein n=1 Tax=Azorhizobium sp. AG788 TaxID=2183897 RepID=UPI00105F85B0|nr:transglutaminase family protein [Azorhizobium sp. AG788]TDT93760.1 transglutaminase-like putative cysteine protease [Azorhizobium sp. AG788]
MLYDIRQTTSYSYAGVVRATKQVLRMSPVDRQGHQHVIAHVLDVTPKPSELERGRDFFGNGIAWMVVDAAHDRLDISTRSRIEVSVAPLPEAETTPTVASIRLDAMASQDLGPASPVHGLYASRSIPLELTITEWAATSFPDERPVLAAALELMHRIHDDFAYQPGTTTVTTLPVEAFDARSGVCQDFAHVMIAGLRGAGLPARYVSGYLRTIPPEGQPRLAGADATHAWVEVWCGARIGWIGLDPTNAIPAGEDHVILAIGRDYADVSPVDGVVVSSGNQILAVGVDVIPVERPQADAPAS